MLLSVFHCSGLSQQFPSIRILKFIFIGIKITVLGTLSVIVVQSLGMVVSLSHIKDMRDE